MPLIRCWEEGQHIKTRFFFPTSTAIALLLLVCTSRRIWDSKIPACRYAVHGNNNNSSVSFRNINWLSETVKNICQFILLYDLFFCVAPPSVFQYPSFDNIKTRWSVNTVLNSSLTTNHHCVFICDYCTLIKIDVSGSDYGWPDIILRVIVCLSLMFSSLCSVTAQRSRGKATMVPCDTEYPAFVSERTIKETTGNMECDGCVRYHTRSLIVIITTQMIHRYAAVLGNGYNMLCMISCLGAADPLSYSRSPAAISSWLSWTTHATAAILHQ